MMHNKVALTRTSIRRIVFAIVLLVTGFGQAHAQTAEIYAAHGKAIDGYDPVAYFTLSRPVKGVDSLSYH